MKSTGVAGIVPVPVSKIAETWGFQVFTTNLTPHHFSGGLFDLYESQQTIYLEKNNSQSENNLILAYLLCLWDLLGSDFTDSKTQVEASYEQVGGISKEDLYLDILNGQRQEALKMAVSLLVPEFDLKKILRAEDSSKLLGVALKFNVSLNIAGYALEQNDLYLSKKFKQDYVF